MIKLFSSIIFTLISNIRFFLYTKGFFKIHRFNTRVISIGNLTMGGSGKTPLVLFLAEYFYKKGIKCAVVEKGYKSKIKKNEVLLIQKENDNVLDSYKDIGDEPMMILKKYSVGNRLAICSDKTKAVASIVNKWKGTELVFIDDGFQHLKLHRDVNIVLLDSSAGFSERFFPKGKLREPYTALKRADLLIFTRSEYIDPSDRDSLIELARSYNSKIKIFFSSQQFYTSKSISGKKILPVSAIANPTYFHKNLVECGAVFKTYISFMDHHKFSVSDYQYIKNMADKIEPEYIVMTEKDLVKIDKNINLGVPVVSSWYEHRIEQEEELLCELYPVK